MNVPQNTCYTHVREQICMFAIVLLHYTFDVLVEGICLAHTLCKFQAWQICIKGNNG